MGSTRRKNTVRRNRKKPPKGYDSWFEYEAHQDKLKGCSCHTETVTYTQIKTYNPDFIYYGQEGRVIYIETKGRFRDFYEYKKYLDVKRSLTMLEELVFVFMDADKPMPNSKERKNGTKLTHGEWAEKNGFTYYTLDTVPKEWSC